MADLGVADTAAGVSRKRLAEEQIYREREVRRLLRASRPRASSLRACRCFSWLTPALWPLQVEAAEGVDTVAGATLPDEGDDAAEEEEPPHPWVGTWNLWGREECAAGKCRDPKCSAWVPRLRVEEAGGTLLLSNFSFGGLSDPMSEDPFEYPGGATLDAAEAQTQPTVASFSAEDTGCGVKSVTVELAFTADAAAGGAPGRKVVMTYDVKQAWGRYISARGTSRGMAP